MKLQIKHLGNGFYVARKDRGPWSLFCESDDYSYAVPIGNGQRRVFDERLEAAEYAVKCGADRYQDIRAAKKDLKDALDTD